MSDKVSIINPYGAKNEEQHNQTQKKSNMTRSEGSATTKPSKRVAIDLNRK